MSGAARQLRFTWRSAALEPDSGLSWRARLAAAVYCEYANRFGELDPAPSAGTVAERMGVAVRTVDNARRELEDAGWLAIERRPGRPSRMVLLTTTPPHVVRDTPARTPARTPAPPATEPGEPGESGEADPPENNLNSRLTSHARDVIAAAVAKRELEERGQ